MKGMMWWIAVPGCSRSAALLRGLFWWGQGYEGRRTIKQKRNTKGMGWKQSKAFASPGYLVVGTFHSLKHRAAGGAVGGLRHMG